MRRRDQRHADHLMGDGEPGRIDPQQRTDEVDEQAVGADVDRGRHEHEPAQVEPRRGPAPALAAEDRAPVIQAARGRERGRDLRHAQRDDQREAHADGPDDARGRAADRAHAELQRGDAAREDADDRKRDGEVREAAHAAEQLLRVAHAAQELDVFGRFHALATAIAARRPGTRGCPRGVPTGSSPRCARTRCRSTDGRPRGPSGRRR